MISMEGNSQLREGYNRVVDMIDQVVEDLYSGRLDYHSVIAPLGQMRTWMYSNDIEKLRGKAKSVAKIQARSSINAVGIREDLEQVSSDYRMKNYDVLPTIPIMKEEVDYSSGTIKTYGDGLHTSAAINTEKRIECARGFNPDKKQDEIAKILGMSVRTVQRYWNK